MQTELTGTSTQLPQKVLNPPWNPKQPKQPLAVRSTSHTFRPAWGLSLGDEDFGFWVWGFRVWGLRFGVWDF